MGHTGRMLLGVWHAAGRALALLDAASMGRNTIPARWFEVQASLVLLVLPGLPTLDEVALAHRHELLEQRRARRDHPVRRALSVQRSGLSVCAVRRILPLARLLPVPAVQSVQSVQPLEPPERPLSWPRLRRLLDVRW